METQCGMEPDLTVFKACADATRLRLLYILCERELCVCELVEVLEMPQGKVSRHLALLRQAKLVDDRRDGVWIHYSLAAADTPLKRRLFAFLRATRQDRDTAVEDLRRLRALSATGDLCTSAGRGAAIGS